MSETTPESRPLTREECEEAESEFGHHAITSGLSDLEQVGRRALADLRRLRELLEMAPSRLCHNNRHADFDAELCRNLPPGSSLCDACTWNAERKRALEGWGKP